MSNPNTESQVQQFASEWEKFVTSQVAHVESLLTEISKLEAKGFEKALTSFEEAGRYAKESVALAERVTGEWRKLALEATRRAAQLVTPRP